MTTAFIYAPYVQAVAYGDTSLATFLKDVFDYPVTVATVDSAWLYDYIIYDVPYFYRGENYTPGAKKDERKWSVDLFLETMVVPEVIEDRVRSGTASILIDIRYESFFHAIPMIYAWADLRGYPRDAIVYLIGATNATEVYEEMCRSQLIGDQITVLGMSTFESITRNMEGVVFPECDLTKKFLFLNRTLRPHRVALLALLQKQQLLDNCHYSFNTPIPDHMLDAVKDKFADVADVSLAVPKYLDFTDGIIRNNTYPVHDAPVIQFYNQTLFSIVTETEQYNQLTSFNEVPYLFLTDKTFKTFSLHHVPILSAGFGNVKYLRDSGFDVFDDIVNHSYDYIINDVDRMAAVVKEVARLDQLYTLQDCQNLRTTLRPRLESNRNRLLSRISTGVRAILTDIEKITKGKQ
jgi:hypothetical protein